LRKILNIGWLIGSAAPRTGRNRTAAASASALVAIGSSAGGPAALEVLLKGLPRDFPAPSCWCSTWTRCSPPAWPNGWHGQGLPVRLAREGEPPQSGVVLLAGTNHHIRLLKNGTLAYTAEPVNEIYRPSIDVFFESVASTGTAMRWACC
jgi:two-component system response regulator WspF